VTARVLVNEARARLRAGDVDAAASLFSQATDAAPEDADAWFGLGVCRAERGTFEQAIGCFERSLTLAPAGPAPLLLALSNALIDAGRTVEGIERARDLVRRHPSFAPGWNALGAALVRAKRPDEAAQAFAEATRADAGYWTATVNLAELTAERGDPAGACALIDSALRRSPATPALWRAGVRLRERARDLDATVLHYQRWITADASSFEARYGLGRALHRQARVVEAIEYYRQALRLEPDHADAHNDLGNAYTDIAEIELAQAEYRRALAIRPDYAAVHSNLLVNLHYRDDVSPDAMFAAHRDWAARHVPPVSQLAAARRLRESGGRLRIGFLSGTFRAGPVGWILEPVLARLDRKRFVVCCYSNATFSDEITARIEMQSDLWRDVSRLDDTALAARIVDDGVDILVDLAGHGPGNRLRAIARKPAPVIATWLDYFDTTGVDAVDYVLADETAVPRETRQRFTEEVVRFAPTRLCYSPPEVSDTDTVPPRRDDVVTFGSFNRLSKLPPAVRAAWARILIALPQSRLVLKNAAFADPEARRLFAGHFAGLGISEDRLELRPASPRPQMFAEYRDIDIALDPFPYNGGLTTCDALWMGVPVICIAGDTMISRQSASMLIAAGLDEFIARDVAGYIELAIDWARRGRERAVLRREMRGRMRGSSLCDVGAFARNLENVLADLWERRLRGGWARANK
jgi:predicted O-linked N-acetylglucosamine transferase (SPINDLY family)